MGSLGRRAQRVLRRQRGFFGQGHVEGRRRVRQGSGPAQEGGEVAVAVKKTRPLEAEVFALAKAGGFGSPGGGISESGTEAFLYRLLDAAQAVAEDIERSHAEG